MILHKRTNEAALIFISSS